MMRNDLRPSLLWPRWGQLGALVERIDVGEEVGGVKQHLAQVEAELAGHGGHDVAFDGGDG